MGAYVSKQDEESEISTPHFERYANLMTLESDPRSPSIEGVTRTPIVVPNQLTDPRSPSNYVTRTPVFAIPEPTSPYVRFKMENHGFQDSPLSTGIERLTKQSDSAFDTDEDLAFEIKHLEVTDDEPKKESNEGNVSPLSSKDKVSLFQKDKEKRIVRRSSNKNKNSLLKQALFKPYVDEDLKQSKSENESTSGKTDSGRRPLQSKTNVVFANDNVLQSVEKSTKLQNAQFLYTKQQHKTDAKRVLPLVQDGICEKENFPVY